MVVCGWCVNNDRYLISVAVQLIEDKNECALQECRESGEAIGYIPQSPRRSLSTLSRGQLSTQLLLRDVISSSRRLNNTQANATMTAS